MFRVDFLRLSFSVEWSGCEDGITLMTSLRIIFCILMVNNNYLDKAFLNSLPYDWLVQKFWQRCTLFVWQIYISNQVCKIIVVFCTIINSSEGLRVILNEGNVNIALLWQLVEDMAYSGIFVVSDQVQKISIELTDITLGQNANIKFVYWMLLNG